jgi:hypothetical protein
MSRNADRKATCPTCGVKTGTHATLNGRVWDNHLNKQGTPCSQSGQKD